MRRSLFKGFSTPPPDADDDDDGGGGGGGGGGSKGGDGGGGRLQRRDGATAPRATMQFTHPIVHPSVASAQRPPSVRPRLTVRPRPRQIFIIII